MPEELRENPDDQNKPLQYRVRGGATLPPRLTPDSISVIGHVIANPITPIAQYADELAEGAIIEESSDFYRDVSDARAELIGTDMRKGAIDFLLDHYEEDMKLFPGLAPCLLSIKEALRNLQWERAVREFRAAKARFKF